MNSLKNVGKEFDTKIEEFVKDSRPYIEKRYKEQGGADESTGNSGSNKRPKTINTIGQDDAPTFTPPVLDCEKFAKPRQSKVIDNHDKLRKEIEEADTLEKCRHIYDSSLFLACFRTCHGIRKKNLQGIGRWPFPQKNGQQLSTSAERQP